MTALHVVLAAAFGLLLGIFFGYTLAVLTGDAPVLGRLIAGWRRERVSAAWLRTNR